MELNDFTLSVSDQQIAHLVWDMPNRSMNVITMHVMDQLEYVIDKLAADEKIKGCVITSGKAAFSGGADLTMLESLSCTYLRAQSEEGEESARQKLFDLSRRLSLIYRKLETSGKKWVAAINGLCLGGAFELALACHHRISAEDDSVAMGLPEIKIGLFPGAGGTQRVARLLPTGDALQMLLKGDQLRPSVAKKLGLLHQIVPKDQLISASEAWILSDTSTAVAPWDQKDFKLPSGRIYSPQGMMLWAAANGLYRRETYDNYPGARAILQSVYEGLQLPIDLGLQVESRYFAHVLRTPEARAMIRSLFISRNELNKGARRPTHIPPSSIKRIGIVGSGFMGCGIAYVSARAGLEVVVIDQTLAHAQKAVEYVQKIMSGQIMKGRATGADRDRLLARLHPTESYEALRECDLVIEAVFEDPSVKGEILSKIAAFVSDKCVIATNTSTLPISQLAKSTHNMSAFVGIHFFSPVEKMLLVEIIKGDKTGDHALALALDYTRLLSKTPIVVNDSRGFYANRCVGNYLREGHLMLCEGIPPAMIEQVAKMAGMPIGPLALSDEVGVDLILRILTVSKGVEPTKYDISALQKDKLASQEHLLRQIVEQHQRLGRKNGKGFYDYPAQGTKKLWAGLKALQTASQDPDTLSVEEMKQRFLVTQALEAARSFEENIITDPREADVGSILGFGFAPFTGGTISYMDTMGAKAFVALCQKLESKYGPRFRPNEELLQMATRETLFYDRLKNHLKAA